MLTIFEYLRKRAHDSVVAGVQDAIAQLDGKSVLTGKPDVPTHATSEHPPTIVSTENPVAAPFDPQKYLAGPGLVENSAMGPLPPPRRRGRPRKSGEQA